MIDLQIKYLCKLPVEMNTSKWEEYKSFLQLCLATPIDADRYTERHHVVPREFLTKEEAKDPESMITLTGADHFRAHRLLKDVFPHSGQVYAFISMCTLPKKVRERRGFLDESLEIDPEEYEEARKSASEFLSRTLKGREVPEEQRKKLSLRFKGIPQSEEFVKKRTASFTGRITLTDGIHDKKLHPEEAEAFLKEHQDWRKRGKPRKSSIPKSKKVVKAVNDGTVVKFIAVDKVEDFLKENPSFREGGLLRSQETKDKLRKASTGRKKDEAEREKLRKARLGKAPDNKGKIMITNDLQNKYILATEAEAFLENNPGWRIGGKSFQLGTTHNKGKVGVTDGTTRMYISKEDVDQFLFEHPMYRKSKHSEQVASKEV